MNGEPAEICLQLCSRMTRVRDPRACSPDGRRRLRSGGFLSFSLISCRLWGFFFLTCTDTVLCYSLSRVRLCDPTDCSLPGSSVHGILQARILEWVTMPSSRGSSQPRDRAWFSCIADGFFTSEPLGRPYRYTHTAVA